MVLYVRNNLQRFSNLLSGRALQFHMQLPKHSMNNTCSLKIILRKKPHLNGYVLSKILSYI